MYNTTALTIIFFSLLNKNRKKPETQVIAANENEKNEESGAYRGIETILKKVNALSLLQKFAAQCINDEVILDPTLDETDLNTCLKAVDMAVGTEILFRKKLKSNENIEPYISHIFLISLRFTAFITKTD